MILTNRIAVHDRQLRSTLPRDLGYKYKKRQTNTSSTLDELNCKKNIKIADEKDVEEELSNALESLDSKYTNEEEQRDIDNDFGQKSKKKNLHPSTILRNQYKDMGRIVSEKRNFSLTSIFVATSKFLSSDMYVECVSNESITDFANFVFNRMLSLSDHMNKVVQRSVLVHGMVISMINEDAYSKTAKPKRTTRSSIQDSSFKLPEDTIKQNLILTTEIIEKIATKEYFNQLFSLLSNHDFQKLQIDDFNYDEFVKNILPTLPGRKNYFIDEKYLIVKVQRFPSTNCRLL